MPRPGWTYVRIDDQLPEHYKLDGLKEGARMHLLGTLVEVLAYCSRNLSDGEISDARWELLGTPLGRRLLSERGFAAPTPGGWKVHDYLGHQRSKEEVAALSEAGRKAARRRWDHADRNAEPNAEPNADRIAEPNADRNADRMAPEGSGDADRIEEPMRTAYAYTETETDIKQRQQHVQVEGGPPDAVFRAAAASQNEDPQPPPLTAEERELGIVVQRQLKLSLGREIDLHAAATLAQMILPEGRTVSSPANYLRRVIRDEPRVLAMLPGPAGTSRGTPQPPPWRPPGKLPDPSVATRGAARARELLTQAGGPSTDDEDAMPF